MGILSRLKKSKTIQTYDYPEAGFIQKAANVEENGQTLPPNPTSLPSPQWF